MLRAESTLKNNNPTKSLKVETFLKVKYRGVSVITQKRAVPRPKGMGGFNIIWHEELHQ